MDQKASDPNTAEVRSGIKPQHDKINETLFRKVGDKYIPALIIDNLSGDFIFCDKDGDNQAARLDGSKGEFSFSSLKLPNNKVRHGVKITIMPDSLGDLAIGYQARQTTIRPIITARFRLNCCL